MNPEKPKVGRLLRPDQVKEKLNVSRSKVYDLIYGGHFIVLKVGASLRVTEKSVEDYLERQICLYSTKN